MGERVVASSSQPSKDQSSKIRAQRSELRGQGSEVRARRARPRAASAPGARRQQGRPLWYLLLHGDTMAGGSADYSDNFEAPAGAVLREMLLSGVGLPWTLAASTAIGVALMCTRLLFDTSGIAADNDHIIGSLVVTFSIMAWGEVARPLRFVNIGFGAWLIVAPWVIGGYTGIAAAASVLFGIALIWLAFPVGRIASHFGAWDRIARMRPHLPGSHRHAHA